MMKKRGRGAMIAVFLVTIVVFGAMYGAWTTITGVFSPPAITQTTQISLVIQSGETTPEIADDLYKKGLIRNPLAFRIWARIKGLDTQLQAGAYLLTSGISIDQIIAKLQNGQPDEKRLAVIDGWRLEQIAAQASQAGLTNFNEQQFLTYTHHPGQFPDAAKFPILQNAPSMEGLLYPDTYLIPVNYNTVQVIDMMLTEFDQVVQQNNLVALAQQHQLSEYQMVVLASIAQREAANNGQMPLIAGIYWKRIYQPSSEIGPYLQADPTVQYAYDTDNPPSSAAKYWGHLGNTGGKVYPSSHWNTYKYQGWPPTPIASPNLKALQAAASPAQTNCYYFLSNPKDGSLICASTYQKFQQLEQQYLPQN
jgi:UPF0755 protein